MYENELEEQEELSKTLLAPIIADLYEMISMGEYHTTIPLDDINESVWSC